MIVHVIVGLNIGGAELMLGRLIESLRLKNELIEHRVISLTSVGSIGIQLQRNGIAVEALGMKSMFGGPLALWRLVWRFRTLKPDVVQTWMYHADFLGGIAARLAGIKNVVWRVCTTDVTQGRSKATVFLRGLCARLSNWVPHTVLCVGHAAQRVHLEVGYCPTRTIVVPDGFDMIRLHAEPNEVFAFREACGLRPDDILVGTLGRFNPVKDQRNFVHAASLLARQHPAVRFLMVGRGCDWNNKELASWVAETGVPERFVLLGQRDDAPVCLAAMDVFVLSSKTEGFPNVLGEAMSMGRRCVTTDVGDAAYMLAGLGEVVAPGDSEALAAAVHRMILKPDTVVAELGVRQRTRIEEEFSMERCAQQFDAIYADVIKHPRR